MMRTRGMTLVELLVGMALGSLIVTAAVQLSSDHTRILSTTSSKLTMFQTSRLAVELLSYDLHMAGAGVGYRSTGEFAGVMRGPFNVVGGASFLGNDRQITLDTGAGRTDDIGILRAMGRARTVAMEFSDVVEVCAGSKLAAQDNAMLVSRDGINARSISVLDVAPTSCSDGICLDGCERVRFGSNATYSSHPSSMVASYVDGEIVGELETVVWFVAPNARGVGELRRVDISPTNTCAAADSTCGGTVASGVESVQIRVLQWDEISSVWVDTTGEASISDRRRIRIDLEVVARGKMDPRGSLKEPVQLLDGGCVPGPCGTRDAYERTVIRTSVEVRNSGRHQMR